jgi:hypothetical protein
MVWLVIFYTAAGLLLAAISIPLIWRRIKPNAWYGFRVEKAYRSDAVWYEINAYAGKRLLVAGLLIAFAAPMLALYIPAVDTYAWVMLALAALVLGVGIVQSFRRLDALAK